MLSITDTYSVTPDLCFPKIDAVLGCWVLRIMEKRVHTKLRDIWDMMNVVTLFADLGQM